MIQFARPLLLMALAPAIAAIWWRRRRAAGRRPGAPLRWTAGGLVLIALAGPELRCSGDPTAVVLLDASASQGRPATWDGPIPDGWTVERIRFAAGLEGRGGTLDRTRTDLAPALTMLAERDRPPTAAIIVSDGRFTDAETLEPLLGRMARRGTRFLWVGRAGGGADARVTDLTAAIGADGVVEVTATVAADAAMTRTVAIGWGAGGEPVATGRVRLEPGEPSTVAVLTTRPDGRLGWLRAQLLEDDLLTANNRLVLPVRSTAPTVLWVAAADAAAPTAPDDWRVRQAAFEALPADPSALLAYDAIAVVDASGEALSAAQRAALAGYVNLGGGLVLIGAGPYGPRGRADPLNGVLPLRIEPRPRRPLDVTVLLDASGSMAHPAADGGGRKFDLVRRAVMAMAREGLREGDHLRVFTFAAITVERFKRHVTAADLADLGEILRKVEPAGASWINTALHRAWDRTGSPSADRVVLVFGDLRTGPFDADRWARRLSAAGVHLAVVAVGDGDADGPLKRLADEAGGWFECRADVAEAGALLGRLLDETRRTPLIRRVDVVRPTGLVFGREWITLPAVDARLAAEARPPSEVLAVAGDEAPLLACRDGAGRVVHLAAPLEGPHNRTWRTAVDARALLAAAVGWVRPPAGDGRYGGELRREGTRVMIDVTVEAAGEPVHALALTAWTTDADGMVHETALEPVAPDRYAGVLTAPTDTAARIRVGPAGREAVVWTGVVAGGYGREFAATGVDADALGAVASVTDGHVVDADDVAAHLRALDAAGRTPLASWVLAAALAAALADWATTRATSPPAADRRRRPRAPSSPPTRS